MHLSEVAHGLIFGISPAALSPLIACGCTVVYLGAIRMSMVIFLSGFYADDVDWKRREGHQQDCPGGWPGPDERFPV